MVLLLLLLVLGIALTLPKVQTEIGHYLTEKLNKQYKSDIQIDQVSITIFGAVKLKHVVIKDHHKNNLITANIINTRLLDYKKLVAGQLLFSTIQIDSLLLEMRTYKGEHENNLNQFIALFDDGKPSSGKFILKAKTIKLRNSRFVERDENNARPLNIDFTKINAALEDFVLEGPNINSYIAKMSFQDHRGLFIKNLQSKFSYTKMQILLNDLDVITAESLFKGNVSLNYGSSDFQDFNNRVKFNILIKQASLATNDIRYFYNELGKNQYFTCKGHITGTLNDLFIKKLSLIDRNKSVIKGTVNFKNLFAKGQKPFYMKGEFSQVSATYQHLIQLLPNVLGKKLPTSLRKLGAFTIRGKTELTTSFINADFYMSTQLGNIQSNLKMNQIDNIDNASYVGNIILEEFNIGAFLGKKDLEKVTLNIDVDGKGFKQKNLNTIFSGDIYKIRYNGYTYSKIIVDGKFKNPKFEGKIYVNDPNLFLDFDGFANLNRNEIEYNFKTEIDYANLYKLHLVKNDSIAVFKGGLKVNVVGNNLDDLKGDIQFTETSYQNKKDNYYFENFSIHSSFDDSNERTITVASPDIIQGKIVGKYQINLLQKMIENSLGSLYANYKRNPIKKGQYLKFDFSIYNKIVEVFYPNITIGTSTSFKGIINSDTDDFKLNFTSPKLTASEVILDNVNLNIDNKNPLFNTYVTVDSIKAKQYKIRDFSLINVTTQDTLFVRSEFKGGEKGEDAYSLNLYHTINDANENVVGIQKSELKYRNLDWNLNENDSDKNKVVFDKKLKNFKIEDIVLSHENQKLTLFGSINESTNKDLNLDFKDVQLDKILPNLQRFTVNGNLNGTVNVKQVNAIYQPTSSVSIDSLAVNGIALGKMNLDIKGDQKFEKFYINSSIATEKVELFKADGSFEIVDKKTKLDIDINFEDFDLGILRSFGGDVISNIRGFASGRSNISGDFENLDINGRLYVNKAGLGIPYLNIDFEIEDDAIIDVTERKFIFRNANIVDTKYKTKAKLNGNIEHKKFSDWKLDLEINSNRLVALDTKDSEDAAYFGTAFINGSASIVGPIDNLFIKVDAKSEKGTTVKIPINDAESSGDSNSIHFVTSNEKYNTEKGLIGTNKRKYNGVELEFDFDITPDADVEIILNRSNGHGMKGKGYGSLLFKINTLGKFNMWGDFQAYEGTYNFKYGGIINKEFKIKKGGSIIWEGDPMRANLNLEAIYKTTANPAVLLDNASFNRKVDVEVVIGIKGNLSNLEPDFAINFPTVSSVLKSEIQTKLDDKDLRQRQALVLLSTGSFLSVDGLTQNSIANNLYEKVGDIFGSILNDSDDKIQVGVDLISADNNPNNQTDGRLGLTVTSKISERVSINGKLGVPVGGINDSAIVGDIEVQYRVNEDGTLNLRVFNRENDVNYIGQGIGYTQGIGLTYQVDFTTFSQLLHKIFKNQKLEIVKNPTIYIPDSNLLPDYINFNQEKEKKKPESDKPNRDAIPNDD